MDNAYFDWSSLQDHGDPCKSHYVTNLTPCKAFWSEACVIEAVIVRDLGTLDHLALTASVVALVVLAA